MEHITLNERYKIAALLDLKTSKKEIAAPEQIKGRADMENIPCVSHERIYQFVWQDKKAGGKMYTYLRTQGKKYQKRGDKQAGRGYS